jgi:hypothetical protein
MGPDATPGGGRWGEPARFDFLARETALWQSRKLSGSIIILPR